MAKQSLIWTALPNGYADDKKSLRLSVLLSPRLDAETDPEQLDSFPDFFSSSGDWPATISQANFEVHLGSASVTIKGGDTTSPNRMDSRLGLPDSKTWRALFTGKTYVRGFKFKDLSSNAVLSYSAASMDNLVHNLYAKLASAANDQVPTASTLLADPGWKNLVQMVAENDRRFMGQDTGLRDPEAEFKTFVEGGFKDTSGLAGQMALFQLYHTPPSTPKVDQYAVPADDPRARAQWLGYKQTALPKPEDFEHEIDFHQIVAAMNQFPTLLRKLGLVVDLLIETSALSLTPNARLWVDVQLPPGTGGVTRTADTNQGTRTMLSASGFQPLPRPNPSSGDYRVANGLLVMDPKQFRLLQSDPDGAGLKVMNLVRTLAQYLGAPSSRVDPVSKKEREMGAPALRNAGLMLVHEKRAEMLKNNLNRQKQYDAAAQLIQSGAAVLPPDLYAEDLVRGYRIDVWDAKIRLWRSLCQRDATYDLNSGEVVVKVDKEEGTVRLAATKSPDPSSNPNVIWLHEALISWTGWSLAAPPPGKTIHHRRDPGNPSMDHLDEVGDAEPDIPPGLRLQSAFHALKGSLPRLRYGRQYWMRARVVDLAGNSLDYRENDFGPEQPEAKARTYFRFEPIAPPALALVKPTPSTVEGPAEGESMERMAVRTFNETPADNTIPSIQRARRFAVPARTTAKEAEYHGMLDSTGQVDPSFFGLLANKDNSLAEEKISTAGPLSGGAPVQTGYAVMQQGEKLPYLPDPLTLRIAARIFDLPGFPPDKIIEIPVYPSGGKWPDALPFRIELYEDPADSPHYDEDKGTLFIPVPKSVRATLRLSVMLAREALGLLGVWNWATHDQARENRALQGQNWTLTPWRNIELVHAVQKPLITPELDVRVVRPFAATFAYPNFVASCSIKSTDHLDLRARWNEPYEDLKIKAGENRPRTDHAFAVKITEPGAYAGSPEYTLESEDRIRAGGFFQDKIQKKIHEFNDTRYRRIEYWLDATTRFREFMPAGLLTETVNGSVQPTDEHIKVTGPAVRTWIPNSAPPPAPEVLYVVPTFGWVRSGDASSRGSWRRGGGLRVYLNRPWNASGYGEMLAVVLPSATFTGDPSSEPKNQPLKNFVTQWGNDPIWLSPFVPGAAPKRSNLPLARTAADPSGKWLPTFAPKEEADQPPGPFVTSGLRHPAMLTISDPQSKLEIAPHDVFYDPDRRLWYCDIEFSWGAAYYPFIRLALARYQPVSVSGAHLSNIVLADFMPLVPDRWLNVNRTDQPRTRHVSVFGRTFTDSSSHVEAGHVAKTSVVDIWVERLNPALGEDLGWLRFSDADVKPDLPGPHRRPPVGDKLTLAKERARAKQLLVQRQYDVLVKEKLIDRLFFAPALWSGTVTLPEETGGEARYRLAIAEYEEYLADDEQPYDAVLKKQDRRLVFMEYVELD